METKKIICPCGMDNEFVTINGVEHYNKFKHGNGDPSNGLCFNCHKPLIAEIQAVATAPEPAEPVTDIEKMTVKELKAFADDNGIDLLGAKTKTDIFEVIQDALTPEEPEDEGDDDDPAADADDDV